MAIFKKPALKAESRKKRDIPHGLFQKCPGCDEVVHDIELAQNLRVCPHCDYHFALSAKERIDNLVDPETFVEMDADLKSVDTLRFQGMATYKDRLKNYQERTGLTDAVISGYGMIDGYKVALAVMDFGFLAATMGSAYVNDFNKYGRTWQVLMSADGKELVQARYAVRNNQRNFVKVTLPAGATVWSVSLAGRPIRPGQSPDGSLLLPLEKSRGGEDAPAFAVEILYLTKAAAWSEKGREKVTLPALDLPISRTGLLLYYPPLFRVAAEPGMFHTQEYQNPVSAVLEPISDVTGGIIATRNEPPASPKQADRLEQYAKALDRDDKEKKDATQALLDTFKAKSLAGKVSGILPINVAFPAFGPSIFLVSELTSENQFPAAEFSFQHDKNKKGGVR